ncbi:MAG: class I SAM-dependent methyltransferase [Rhodobacteraceae bacterium]|nr:class I SAM-dependent methyltransferase [Paracoccaceae bacterium]
MSRGKAENRRYKPSYAQDGLVTIHDASFKETPQFRKAYDRGLAANGGFDYNWHWRVHTGLWAARNALNVPGDFIECGVNRGFLSSAIMQDLDWNAQDRIFWLLDTFAGLDTEGISNEENDPGAAERDKKLFEVGLYSTELDEIRANFEEWKDARIVVGSVPGTLEEVTSEQIAFASIDMNSAPPEIAAMEFLWPRFAPGAIILFDDYTYCGYRPQHEAIDDFATRHGVAVLSLPTGQGLLIRPPHG